ncbi:unnamed protein product [Alternaria alternata]
MSSPRGFEPCCLKSFNWTGTPSGHEAKLADNPTYITGSNSEAAVIIIHDGLGWRFKNNRLLADHFAKEANVTVYMPDFFGGESLDFSLIKAGRWAELDMEGFKARNSRSVREPEVFACVSSTPRFWLQEDRSGGLLLGRLGRVASCNREPEHDAIFSDEMKLYAFKKLVLDKKSLPVEWVHFPGVSHGCLTKGDETVPGEREAMVKAKDRAVTWWREWLL